MLLDTAEMCWCVEALGIVFVRCEVIMKKKMNQKATNGKGEINIYLQIDRG